MQDGRGPRAAQDVRRPPAAADSRADATSIRYSRSSRSQNECQHVKRLVNLRKPGFIRVTVRRQLTHKHPRAHLEVRRDPGRAAPVDLRWVVVCGGRRAASDSDKTPPIRAATSSLLSFSECS
jgi:hypothetical protein